MVKACELKKGDVVKIGGVPHIVENVQVQTPSARGAATLYKTRYRNVQTKQKVDQVHRGDDPMQECDLDRREVQYLYRDQHGYAFMDVVDYSQFTLSEDDLVNELPYLTDGLEGIQALISDEKVLGIDLPPVVALAITETEPVMKGASATGRMKPATLTTGHVVKVPEYMEPGEVVRVDTRTGEFLSRA